MDDTHLKTTVIWNATTIKSMFLDAKEKGAFRGNEIVGYKYIEGQPFICALLYDAEAQKLSFYNMNIVSREPRLLLITVPAEVRAEHAKSLKRREVENLLSDLVDREGTLTTEEIYVRVKNLKAVFDRQPIDID